MPLKLSIKDLELFSGIKAHTLRVWEQRYNILTPSRSDGNIRSYNNDDLKKILNVSLLNTNGYKISSIAKLSSIELIEKVKIIYSNNPIENIHVKNLKLCILEQSIEKFKHDVNTLINDLPFETVFEKILLPISKSIRLMWQANLISMAQEQFILCFIKQKLISQTEKIETNNQNYFKTALLFLPPNETYDVDLLYCNYICKTKGYNTIYIGQSTSLKDLCDFITKCLPDSIISALTLSFTQSTLSGYISTLKQKFPNINLLIDVKNSVDIKQINKIEKVIMFDSFEKFKKII
ncbi:MAG: MerR family transcriptional regulator [Bacteroidetes bacterium]|nr:MerR family transcriptional regulator [Bacteroidota bacterium]